MSVFHGIIVCEKCEEKTKINTPRSFFSIYFIAGAKISFKQTLFRHAHSTVLLLCDSYSMTATLYRIANWTKVLNGEHITQPLEQKRNARIKKNLLRIERRKARC